MVSADQKMGKPDNLQDKEGIGSHTGLLGTSCVIMTEGSPQFPARHCPACVR